VKGRCDSDGALDATGPRDVRVGLDVPETLVFESVLPAVPLSVTRMRGELGAALRRHHLAVERLDDIALVFGEAGANVVVHAYVGIQPGPLYAAATLASDLLTVSVVDCGRGMAPRLDSPGSGFGVPLMTRLADGLRISPSGCGAGTCVEATFERATGRAVDFPMQAATSGRGEMLHEYLLALKATSASLHQDTEAVLAQARQAVAHAHQQRRVRERGRR
jgi:anti-sigma regulatory factor (Ser/Thr protein kinase)